MPTATAFNNRPRFLARTASIAGLFGLLTLAPVSVPAQEPAPIQPAPAQTSTTTPPDAASGSENTAPQAAPSPQAVEPSTPQAQAPAPAASEPASNPPPATAEDPASSKAAEPSTAPAQPVSPAADGEPVPAASSTASDEPVAAEDDAAEQPGTIFDQLLPAGERSDIPHDLSPWGMFMAADWVVKGVMIGLAFASLITWTVWLAKSLELTGARARAGRTLKIIRRSATLSEAVGSAAGRGGPAAHMLRAAADEIQLSEAALDHVEGDGVKERVSSALSRIESFAGRRMSRGTGVLATIGSTAPFVGLFGTVWGIMNSFIGISESQTTNLAVVAPGIAEALLATAIGLVAAIPAVVIYNVFARSITGYRQLLADAAAGVERLVSRDLDFRKVPPGSRKASVSLVAGE